MILISITFSGEFDARGEIGQSEKQLCLKELNQLAGTKIGFISNKLSQTC